MRPMCDVCVVWFVQIVPVTTLGRCVPTVGTASLRMARTRARASATMGGLAQPVT